MVQTLADTADPLADSLGGLPHTAGGLPNRPTGAHRLSSGITHTAQRLTGSAARADGLLRGLTDVAESLTDSTTGRHCLLSKIADTAYGIVHRIDQALEDLRIAIERCQRPVKDVVEVLEPHLDPGLCFHSSYVYLDLAYVDVNARDHLQQVCELCAEREMCLQAFNVKVDFIDLDFGDVHMYVRVAARRAPLQLR
ncbi:MAG: hypothetical protein J2P28_23590 [Actinobacteria bacterium]|nr:hypothetical protein [Actinomycetota bacterium]